MTDLDKLALEAAARATHLSLAPGVDWVDWNYNPQKNDPYLTEDARSQYRAAARAAVTAYLAEAGNCSAGARVAPACEEETMSASEAIARLRELQGAAGFDLPIVDIDAYTERNRTPYIIYDGGDRYAWNIAGKEHRAAIVAAMNSLPALLECAEALRVLSWHYEELATMDGDVNREQLQAHDGPLKQARAALDALAEGGGE